MTSARAIGREERGLRERLAHGVTTVSPISALDAEPGGQHGRVQLRDDPADEVPGVEQPVGLVRTERADDTVVDVDAGDVGQEQDPVGAETDGQRGRRLVGVDVQRAGRERGDDRDQPFLQRGHDRRPARSGSGSPTSPSAGDLHGPEPDLVAHQPDARGPDRRAEGVVDRGERRRARPAVRRRLVTRRPADERRPEASRAPSPPRSAARRRARRRRRDRRSRERPRRPPTPSRRHRPP